MRVRVQIANPQRRDEAVDVEEALVDTGASRTMIPRSLATELGLEIVGSSEVQTAAGTQRIDRSYAQITLSGRESIGDIWVSDAYSGVLIGVITLESLGLAVDPKSGQLIDSPFLLL